MSVAVHWFRNDLRLHDNPALFEAISNAENLIAVYIFHSFNTESIGYNPLRFLLESLNDLNDNLTLYGGRLYILQGNPVDIFKRIKETIGIDLITFEQDCDYTGKVRDNLIIKYCHENNMKYIEQVSYTLWNPREIIEKNGGIPPQTFKIFENIVNNIGQPPKPMSNIDWSRVNFGELPISLLEEFKNLKNPSTEIFGIFPEVPEILNSTHHWYGGETRALQQLNKRLDFEKKSFDSEFYILKQINPDLLSPPSSLSAALRYGCLSIRKLFWELSKLFTDKFGDLLPRYSNTSQLIWRDYFYTMSIENEKFDQMEQKSTTVAISWKNIETKENRIMLEYWKNGKTGYPFIDAGMRQLIREGWIHHVVRNSVVCFLTRGDLWISWTEGLNHFLKYLIDANYSICSGNWRWVSICTFDQLLDIPMCICPVKYGLRLDPSGEYIRKYVPELKNMPKEYLYEPWECPESIQKKVGCIIGKDYPNRIIDHSIVSQENHKKMKALRLSLVDQSKIPHGSSSDQTEDRNSMCLPEEDIGVCKNVHTSNSHEKNVHEDMSNYDNVHILKWPDTKMSIN